VATGHADPRTSFEQSDLPRPAPGPGFSEREEAEGQAVEEALLAVVERGSGGEGVRLMQVTSTGSIIAFVIREILDLELGLA
jgi:hypothetical protein